MSARLVGFDFILRYEWNRLKHAHVGHANHPDPAGGHMCPHPTATQVVRFLCYRTSTVGQAERWHTPV
ncbi:MAG: hypothetical protein ABIK07_12455 [Planctomycetota bacterium]